MSHYCRSCQRLGHTPSESTAYHRANPSHVLAFIGAAIVIVAGAWLIGGGLGGGSW